MEELCESCKPHSLHVDWLRNDGTTSLIQAAKLGHHECLYKLIQAGANVNQPGKNKRTALMEAACRKESQCLEMLLEMGADVNALSQCYDTALKLATVNSRHPNIELLISARADVNLGLTNSKYPTLHETIQAEEQELVNKLQRTKVDVTSVKTIAFDLPLMLASQIGDLKSAELLIQGGAQVNAMDNNGASAAILAAVNGSSKVLDLLIQNGADVNICDVTGSTALHYACIVGHLTCIELLIKAGVQSECPSTPLLLAIENSHFDCASLLLQSGADVNKENPAGIMKAGLCRDAKFVKLLIKAGADVNVTLPDSDTPLITVVRQGFTECISLMLQSGADVNAHDKQGCTAVIIAAINNDITSLKSIIQAGGIKKNSKQSSQSGEKVWKRPYKVPAYQQKKSSRAKSSIVSFLQKCTPSRRRSTKSLHVDTLSEPDMEMKTGGVDLDVVFGINDTTALMAAARRGNYQVVEVLIQAGADINATDRRYNTALMIAAVSPVSGSIECIQLLLKAGAYINQRNLDQNGLECALVQTDIGLNPYKKATAKQNYILETKAKLLFAAGENVEGDTVQYHDPMFPSSFESYKEVKVPDFFKQKVSRICLKLMCQDFIRKYFIKLNPRINLFYGAAQIGIPPGLRADMFYGMFLDEAYKDYDDDHEVEDVDVDDNYDYEKDADVYYYRNPAIAHEVYMGWLTR